MRARAIRRGGGTRAGVARAASAAARPSVAALVFLRGRDADGRLRALVAEQAQARPVLGKLAAVLLSGRGFEPLGFRCLGDWSRERLGVGARAVREWARVSAGSRGAAAAAGGRALGRGLLDRGSHDRASRHPGERGGLPRDGARAHGAGG